MSFLKFKADQIFTGTEMLGSNSVLITSLNGIVEEIISVDDAGENIQQLKGTLSPGFINCHCHLELSHLKGIIPEQTGMTEFILNILEKRASPQELIIDAIDKAENEMLQNGIVAVGDICNTTHTLNQKQKNNLYYHNFIEVSEFVPAKAQEKFDAGIKIYNSFHQNFPNQTSLVPHAPYSVSENLFQLISDFSANKNITIHNQESKDEIDFFYNKTGSFTKLYNKLGIDISAFNPLHTSSLLYSLPYLLAASKTILVHNTFTNDNDLRILNLVKQNSETQFYLCVCVLANRYISGTLPTAIIKKENFDKIVIGTDSLASNRSLDILSELNTMKQNFSQLTDFDLLRFATFNGAAALGIYEKFGSFKPKSKPGILLLNGLNNNKINLSLNKIL